MHQSHFLQELRLAVMEYSLVLQLQVEQLQKGELPPHCTGISKVMCSTLVRKAFLLLSCFVSLHIQSELTIFHLLN